MFIWTTRTILVFGKKSSWCGNALQKNNIFLKITFWDYCEHEFIFWRYVLKSSPMLGCSRRGLYFWQINISGNFRHAHFGKSVHFLIFGHFFRRRRRRRRRRRADNFSIWPEPHPIVRRDEISRSGIPHFDKSFFDTGCFQFGVFSWCRDFSDKQMFSR